MTFVYIFLFFCILGSGLFISFVGDANPSSRQGQDWQEQAKYGALVVAIISGIVLLALVKSC